MKRMDLVLPVILVGAVAVAVASGVSAQEEVWEVPAEVRAVENPVEGTPEVVEEGAGIYKRRCQLCHGAEGKGDGPMTKRIQQKPPRDLTTAEIQERLTDGEIFYKINTGNPPMPSMEGTLTEDEVWSLVHFVRTLQAN